MKFSSGTKEHVHNTRIKLDVHVYYTIPASDNDGHLILSPGAMKMVVNASAGALALEQTTKPCKDGRGG